MANAMVALGNLTLSGTATSIAFSSIPATYRDLRLVIVGIGSGSADDVNIYLNNDTGYNYSRVYMYANGSSAGASSDTGANSNAAKITYYGSISSSEINNIEVDFLDSSATDKQKTYLTRSNRAGSGVDAVVSRWANTAAVTSVMVKAATTSFATGTTFALYGIVS